MAATGVCLSSAPRWAGGQDSPGQACQKFFNDFGHPPPRPPPPRPCVHPPGPLCPSPCPLSPAAGLHISLGACTGVCVSTHPPSLFYSPLTLFFFSVFLWFNLCFSRASSFPPVQPKLIFLPVCAHVPTHACLCTHMLAHAHIHVCAHHTHAHARTCTCGHMCTAFLCLSSVSGVGRAA